MPLTAPAREYTGDGTKFKPAPPGQHRSLIVGVFDIGTHTRQAWKFNDTYTIDMSGDPERKLDRRLVLAIAVGMDALQAR